MIAKGETFVEMEISRLQRMLDTGAVGAAKVDEFLMRINILRSFRGHSDNDNE